eukprot:CAMPEP_0172528950 /NCGR_PEP_ID=MMETSP1067-20121228/3154_1 /TAXON_ID=265564 ORGANISM="Thalassiosira punctigera, Strain Tpunct2005C2" /NCGR_SAMPLE_ID=MMETSP1067 /ASSEMBLY_ACC=CAM_ASM_000444 /LENGTH=739 /DNA_ID=CAMNT_0013312929 /DNA_START=30 /DNA_END=2249 /DNA_ORIENTATION=+
MAHDSDGHQPVTLRARSQGRGRSVSSDRGRARRANDNDYHPVSRARSQGRGVVAERRSHWDNEYHPVTPRARKSTPHHRTSCDEDSRCRRSDDAGSINSGHDGGRSVANSESTRSTYYTFDMPDKKLSRTTTTAPPGDYGGRRHQRIRSPSRRTGGMSRMKPSLFLPTLMSASPEDPVGTRLSSSARTGRRSQAVVRSEQQIVRRAPPSPRQPRAQAKMMIPKTQSSSTKSASLNPNHLLPHSPRMGAGYTLKTPTTDRSSYSESKPGEMRSGRPAPVARRTESEPMSHQHQHRSEFHHKHLKEPTSSSPHQRDGAFQYPASTGGIGYGNNGGIPSFSQRQYSPSLSARMANIQLFQQNDGRHNNSDPPQQHGHDPPSTATTPYGVGSYSGGRSGPVSLTPKSLHEQDRFRFQTLFDQQRGRSDHSRYPIDATTRNVEALALSQHRTIQERQEVMAQQQPMPQQQQPMLAQQPLSQQPVAQQPTFRSPMSQQPVAQQPMTQQQSMTRQPMAQQLSVTQQQQPMKPLSQWPVAQQPVAQQPMSRPPMFQQPVARQPISQQTMTQQQSMTHQPMTQQQSVTQQQSMRQPPDPQQHQQYGGQGLPTRPHILSANFNRVGASSLAPSTPHPSSHNDPSSARGFNAPAMHTQNNGVRYNSSYQPITPMQQHLQPSDPLLKVKFDNAYQNQQPELSILQQHKPQNSMVFPKQRQQQQNYSQEQAQVQYESRDSRNDYPSMRQEGF